MAPNQPRGAANQGHNVPTCSRSAGISKFRASPITSKETLRTHLTEYSQARSVLFQRQNHTSGRAQPMPSVRPAPDTQNSHPQTPRRAPLSSGQHPPAATLNAGLPMYIPKVLHAPHPDSKLCQNFHWVPYPLGLMPYESWHFMHHRPSPSSKYRFRCPVCFQERVATVHTRKVFLIAERLTWNDAIVLNHDQDLNEELNWAVNYEVGILEPCVEDGRQISEGKKSQKNQYHPYQNEHEMRLALKLIFMIDEMTPATWSLWIEAQMNFQKLLDEEEPMRTGAESDRGPTAVEHESRLVSKQQSSPLEPVEMIDLTGSPEPESVHQMVTPPSSLIQAKNSLSQPKSSDNGTLHHRGALIVTEQIQPRKRIQSYKTLQDFYSLLDKIERTSYVGALFLEAYAEKLRDDMCKSCWFRHNVRLDLY